MNKIVIIVLILIAVVFFISVGVGSSESEPERDPKKVDAPAGSEGFSNLFGGLQEKVTLPCDPTSAANVSLKCQRLLLGSSTVPPAKEPWLPFLKKSTFRTAKVVLLSGQASVLYLDGKGGSKIKNPQRFDLPNPDNDGSRVESIVFLENGGSLNISCKANTNCQVGQQ